MRLISKNFFSAVCLFFIGGIFLTGCGKSEPSVSAKDAIATVNGTRVPVSDLKKEMELRVRQDPSFKITSKAVEEQIAVMVNRRLLIEEAISRKLTEQDGFKTAIRLYWEQTLIRLLLDSLSKDFGRNISVTEDEIKDYYSKLDRKMSFEIIRSKDQSVVDKAEEMAQKGEPLRWDETVKPLTYDQVNSEILAHAFDLKAGDFKVYDEDNVFYLVHVLTRETASAPAMDSIRDKIQARIVQRKQGLAFEQWLKEKKKKADIKVNLQALKDGSTNGLTQAASAQ